jgi:hypothetical protein
MSILGRLKNINKYPFLMNHNSKIVKTRRIIRRIRKRRLS